MHIIFRMAKRRRLFIISTVLLTENLEDRNLAKLYKEVELPLVDVLFDMEEAGFKVDVDILNDLNKSFRKNLTVFLGEIMQLAGKPFNVNSTKQLASVLFEDLGLKTGKED